MKIFSEFSSKNHWFFNYYSLWRFDDRSEFLIRTESFPIATVKAEPWLNGTKLRVTVLWKSSLEDYSLCSWDCLTKFRGRRVIRLVSKVNNKNKNDEKQVPSSHPPKIKKPVLNRLFYICFFLQYYSTTSQFGFAALNLFIENLITLEL